MNTYESLRVALKNATTIRLGDETYHVDCFDTDADELSLSNDDDEFSITVDEMIETYGDAIQMWEIVPLTYKKD